MSAAAQHTWTSSTKYINHTEKKIQGKRLQELDAMDLLTQNLDAKPIFRERILIDIWGEDKSHRGDL